MISMTARKAKANFISLFRKVTAGRQPVLITGNTNNCVLISIKEWTALQETLYLLCKPKIKESVLKGLRTPAKKCAKKIKW
jgi:antitoxin YefM